MTGIFDPNTWGCDLPYQAIWLDPEQGLYCLVDMADYDWLSQWTWRAIINQSGSKYYAERSTTRKGKSYSVYMHKAILSKYKKKPTLRHKMGDHLNGDSLDNRLVNLRWATISMNNANRGGIAYRQGVLL